MSNDEKWAANIAFTGSKENVKKILALVEELEDKGEIEDYTEIDGPYDSLQLMLKRRVENLSLEPKGEPDPLQLEKPESQLDDES